MGEGGGGGFHNILDFSYDLLINRGTMVGKKFPPVFRTMT